MATCRYCGEVETWTRPRPDTPAHAEELCKICNAHIKWVPKPKNKDKREKRPCYPRPEQLGINYCQICLLPKVNLLTNEVLETHHVNGDSTDRSSLNFLVVCTACHSVINWLRTYRMRHHLKNIGIYDEWIETLKNQGADVDE